jgi:hypothetical protein
MAMRCLKKAALCFGLIAATLASQDVSPVMAETTKQHLTGGNKYQFSLDNLDKEQRDIFIRTGTKHFEWNSFGEGGVMVMMKVDLFSGHVSLRY